MKGRIVLEANGLDADEIVWTALPNAWVGNVIQLAYRGDVDRCVECLKERLLVDVSYVDADLGRAILRQ